MVCKFLFSFSQLVLLFSVVFMVEETFADDKASTTKPITTKPTTTKPTTTKPTTTKPTTTKPTTTKPTTTKPTTTKPTTTPKSANVTTVKPTSTSSTVAPTNQTTVTPTTSNHTTPLPTTSSPSNTSTVPTPGPTGHSRDCNTCEDKLDKERHYKWVAVAFDIIFAIAFIIMLILYLRQRKMYREMEGDGSLSRLI